MSSTSQTTDSQLKRLLRLRSSIKDHTPKFQRQESWRYKRVGSRWRRPKGIDSKMRLKRKGWPQSPNVGYRGPRKTRGLHAHGLTEVLVYTPSELEFIDPKTHIIRIARVVGGRKKKQILDAAETKGFTVINKPRAKEEGEEETEAEEGAAQEEA